MNLIYSSDQYSVVEFNVDEKKDALRFGGYEILDKAGRRETFIDGLLAKSFREYAQQLFATEPTVEKVDGFLGNYEALMSQPLAFH